MATILISWGIELLVLGVRFRTSSMWGVVTPAILRPPSQTHWIQNLGMPAQHPVFSQVLWVLMTLRFESRGPLPEGRWDPE